MEGSGIPPIRDLRREREYPIVWFLKICFGCGEVFLPMPHDYHDNDQKGPLCPECMRKDRVLRRDMISKQNLLRYLEREYGKWDCLSGRLATQLTISRNSGSGGRPASEMEKIAAEGFKAATRAHLLGVLITEISTWDEESTGTELDLTPLSYDRTMDDIRTTLQKISEIVGKDEEWVETMVKRVSNVVGGQDETFS